MKRINSLCILAILLLVSILAMTLVSCGPQEPDVPDTPGENPNGPEDNPDVPDMPGDNPNEPDDKPAEPEEKPDNELINFALDGNSVYSAEGLGANASNLRFRISSATKNTIPDVGKIDNATIRLLAMEGFDAKESHTVGRYSITVKDGKLIVCATDTKAMQFAVSRLSEMIDADGFKLAEGFNESCVFDNYRSAPGKLAYLTDEDIALLDVAEGIYADGVRIKGFTPYISELNTTATKLDGYPTISAAATSNKASVSITQPKDNGGIGIVTVSNAGKTRTYLINVKLESVYMDASVINKNNTRGTITFVIDDADQESAAYVSNTIFKANGNVKVSYAIITNKLVTMQKTADGEEWMKDENGRYVYTTNDSVVEFWRGVLSTGRADFTSHSHTHLYWGDDDGGGVFDYVLNNGSHATSQYFPKGNVTMELLASKQVLEDLFGVESNIFIKPGVGAKLSQYYLDLLEDAGFYLGARNTASSPTNPIKMVNNYKDFVSLANRFNIRSYMIQHYNTSAEKVTDVSSSNADCLSAGIPYWTDYIDTAIDNGGWACFCIHLIRPDTHTGSGHYIYQSQADALFAHADAYGKDVWFATLEEASKYYFLRSGTTVRSELVSDNRIELVLTDTEASPLYNDVELTLRVSVPEHWEAAMVDKTAYEVQRDEQGSYIIINAMRGARLNIEGISSTVEDDADFEYKPIQDGIGSTDISGGSLALTASTVVYYNKEDVFSSNLAIKLAVELSRASGMDIKAFPDDNINGEGYIRITSIDDSCLSLIKLKRISGRVDAYQAYWHDGGLHLIATTEQALSIGVDFFINSLAFNTLTVDGEEVFLSQNGEALDRNVLNSDTTLASILVNGVPIDSFSPDKTEYVYYTSLFSGYPVVSCEPYFGLSRVVISQPSVASLGECKITVYAHDGGARSYFVTVKDNSVATGVKIVHKGGADAVVSFVF